MKKFKEDEILILLGAGSSCDAGIKNSNQIISDIESKITEVNEWKRYSNIYNYIKSVYYQKQLHKGVSIADINFNIENLVSLLNIIISIKEKSLDIYSFVGSWEKDLTTFINDERSNNLANQFRESIIKCLRGDWLMPSHWIEKSKYFEKLIDFKRQYDGNALKIFTLNYDKCVEHNLRGENLECGFNDFDKWNSKNYDYENTKDYYLFKLHGSIDWKKRKEEPLMQTTGEISPDELAIIFGISNKLQSYDPYLFYFYEFRIHCSKSKLVISSGYGFLDDHINEVFKYGFENDSKKRFVVNVYEPNRQDEEEDIKKEISDKLSICTSQIRIFNKKAKEFFEDDLDLNKLSNLFDDIDEDLPKGM